MSDGYGFLVPTSEMSAELSCQEIVEEICKSGLTRAEGYVHGSATRDYVSRAAKEFDALTQRTHEKLRATEATLNEISRKRKRGMAIALGATGAALAGGAYGVRQGQRKNASTIKRTA